MIGRKRSLEILALLHMIEDELESGRSRLLQPLFGELRDALWHEVPLDIARAMDVEDGLDPDRGEMRP